MNYRIPPVGKFDPLILSDGLRKKVAKDEEFQRYVRKVTLWETIIYYFVDSSFRKAVKVQSWMETALKTNYSSALVALKRDYPNIDTYTNKEKVSSVLAFVHANISYTLDSLYWQLNERWQTPEETWNLKHGDCEDGALLIYVLLKSVGVPDLQLRIVAGDVRVKLGESAGHAYVVWFSDEDAFEYPIDWCYWYVDSQRLRVPYVSRDEYFNGKKEWFSFNSEGVYKNIY